MANRLLMNVDEVIEELGVSRTFAYKLIQKLNKELEAKGFIVISGKVNRKYFEEQFYGMTEEKQKGAS
ncbi:MAG: DNA-binding protein [Clostridia bacterium]|nr:DNA-binding protein [Clostridia bacterium]